MDNLQENMGNAGSHEQNLPEALPTPTTSTPEVPQFDSATAGSESNPENLKNQERIKTSIAEVRPFSSAAGGSESNPENVKQPDSFKTSILEVRPFNPNDGPGASAAENVKHLVGMKASIAEVQQFNHGAAKSGAKAEKHPDNIAESPTLDDATISKVRAKVEKRLERYRKSTIPEIPGAASSRGNTEKRPDRVIKSTSVSEVHPLNPFSASGVNTERVKQPDRSKISIREVRPFNPGADPRAKADNVKHQEGIKSSIPEVQPIGPDTRLVLNSEYVKGNKTSFPEVQSVTSGLGLSLNIENTRYPDSGNKNSIPCVGSSSNRQEQKGKAPVAPENELKLINNIAGILGPKETEFLLFQGHENEHMAHNFIQQLDRKPPFNTNANEQNVRVAPPAPAAQRLDTKVSCLFCYRNMMYDVAPFQRRMCGHYYHLHCFHAQPHAVKEWHMKSAECNFCTRQ